VTFLTIHTQQKFDPGSYVHGLWTSSLEHDLAWTLIATREPAVDRFSSEPSWSWMSAALGSLQWFDLEGDRYYQLHDIIKAETMGNTIRPASLCINGFLLPVSLQTWAEKGSLENDRVLTRSCRVIEHRDQHYLSPKREENDGRIRYPPMPGSYECGYNTYNDATTLPLHGELRADYKFWSSEEELQYKLQQVVFVVFGREDTRNHRVNGRKESFCIIAGLLLRPKDNSDGREEFERIGWLRYSTGVVVDDYVPAGTKTQFILV
jgi:hypothetical protein